MIVFLTLLYCGLLVLLIKFKVIRPTLWWKISPAAWVLFLLIALFIPMAFFAPQGDLRVFGAVIPIVPRVTGRVIEIPVTPNTPVKKGDVLLRIDPEPYEFQVKKLEAALANAGVNVAQLTEQMVGSRAATEQARASLLSAETDFERRARETWVQAKASIEQVRANLGVSRANFRRIEQAAAKEAVSEIQVDQARREVESLQAQLQQAEAAERNARLNYEAGGDRVKSVREQLAQAEARERSTRLAYEARIDGVNPQIQQVLADLKLARWNLEETIVYAPADGYVTNLAARPGFVAASIPLSPIMTFVDTSENAAVLWVKQTNLRHVQPGQEAELLFDMYPGKIFRARVVSVVRGTRQGQVTAVGSLAADTPQQRSPFPVRLELEDEARNLDLPPGIGGTGAVFTGKGKPTYLIRRVMLRMQTYLNYIL